MFGASPASSASARAAGKVFPAVQIPSDLPKIHTDKTDKNKVKLYQQDSVSDALEEEECKEEEEEEKGKPENVKERNEKHTTPRADTESKEKEEATCLEEIEATFADQFENEMQVDHGQLDCNDETDSAPWWRTKCAQAELRASFSEARNESLVEQIIILQERLLQESNERGRIAAELAQKESFETALEKYHDRLHRILENAQSAQEAETASAFGDISPQSRQYSCGSPNARTQNTVALGEIQAIQIKLTETENSLDEALIAQTCAKRELEDLTRQLKDRTGRLELAENFVEESRKEHENAMKQLTEQMKQAAEKRAQMEASRTEERRRQKEKQDAKFAELKGKMLKLQNALDKVQEERDAATSKSEANARELEIVKKREEAAQLEMATMKIDLATRRSDEDDLIARLEQQAIEFSKAQKRKKDSQPSGSAGGTSVGNNGSDWSSWMTSLVASKK